MARISGVTIPNEKQLHVALTYVYGIGPKHSADILKAANVDGTVRVYPGGGDTRQHAIVARDE